MSERGGGWRIWRLYHDGWTATPEAARIRSMREHRCSGVRGVPQAASAATRPSGTPLFDHQRRVVCPCGLASHWYCPDRSARRPLADGWKVEPLFEIPDHPAVRDALLQGRL